MKRGLAAVAGGGSRRQALGPWWLEVPRYGQQRVKQGGITPRFWEFCKLVVACLCSSSALTGPIVQSFPQKECQHSLASFRDLLHALSCSENPLPIGYFYSSPTLCVCVGSSTQGELEASPGHRAWRPGLCGGCCPSQLRGGNPGGLGGWGG